MPLSRTSRACLAITISATVEIAIGTPNLAFPVNSQVPPVAYVEQPYDFTFSPTTFTTDNSEILYALAGNPEWLSIDSSSRRLSGTPTYKDAGAASFRLVASDKTGQTTSTVVLVTLQNSTISAGTDILTPLAQVGSVSVPATLLLYQLQHLSFNIPVSLFQGVSSSTHYYAVSADGSPLPSWLQFDPISLQFSGTTPPLLAPTPTSQAYDFKLAVSNVAGFSEAEIDFQIMVGSHLLAFTNPRQNISITRGDHMEISSLLEQLTLDGKKVSRSDLSFIKSTAPDWLSFDDTKISLEGTVPKDAESSSFTISAYSNSSNTANVTLLLQIAGAQIASQVDLGSYNATAGTFFSHTIRMPDSASTVSNRTADLGVLASWLRFDSHNMTVYGVVPTSISPQTFITSITFNDNDRTVVAALRINVMMRSPVISSTTYYTRSGTIATSSITSAITGHSVPTVGRSSTQRDNTVKITLCVVLPTVALILMLALILCTLHGKRKQRRAVFSSKIGVAGNNVPAPLHGPISTAQLTSILTPTSRSQSNKQSSNVQAPQIELSWPTDSIKGARKRLSRKQGTVRSSTIGPSWDDLIRLPTPVADLNNTNSLPLAVLYQQNTPEITVPAPVWTTITNTENYDAGYRPSLEQIDQATAQRASTALSSMTVHPAGLLKRMSGAGHGAGVKETRSMPPYRSSWQTTFETIPLVDSRPSTVLLGSLVPLQPEVTDAVSHQKYKPLSHYKPTVRLVDKSGDSSNEFEVARQRFYTDRARHQLEGNSRFTNINQNSITSRNKIETETGRPSLHPLSENGNAVQSRHTPQSWSQWSGVGPAATSYHARTTANLTRDYSVASSRQFDSAISSDSQWEDDDLVADENSAGERYWQTNTAAPTTMASPRVPFEQRGQETEDNLKIDRKTRLNLADQRKRVSVGEMDLQRNERSHKGSFRFI